MTPHLTVIIPTYNRPDVVGRALRSLQKQTLAHELFAVIVVDDSSNNDSGFLADQDYPFAFSYLRQDHRGATSARNHGAQQASSDLLIFMDDDVTASEAALQSMLQSFLTTKKALVMGTIRTCYDGTRSPYAEMAVRLDRPVQPKNTLGGNPTLNEVDCVQCNTEFLAVKRKDFFELGMFHDPTGDWPNWDDVDFGFRAARQGFRLYVAPSVRVEHWDYSLVHLQVAAQRWRRASRAAVKLFQTHPDLQEQLPMFLDKFPIRWFQDPPKLIARKIARWGSSNKAALFLVEQLTYLIERMNSSWSLLSLLYRWVNGAYMYQGVREGLKTVDR